MSSSKYSKKKLNISTFDLINNTKLSLTKVFKDLGTFVAENFNWNHLYLISSPTSFQILKKF